MYVHSIFTGWSRKLSAGYSRGLLSLFGVVDFTTLWLKAVLAVQCIQTCCAYMSQMLNTAKV